MLSKKIERVKYTQSHILFECEGGEVYSIFHDQVSDENAKVESIMGNFMDIIDSPITRVETFSFRVTLKVDHRGNKKKTATHLFVAITAETGSVNINYTVESKNKIECETINFTKI